MYRLLQALGLAILLFCLAGCVTAVSEDLPFAQIPKITVATGVDLAVSPSHPNDTLPTAHVAAGETVQVIGTDKDAAWLLVLYNNKMGWMPSIFSQTNIASLPSAVVVEPLSDRCTRYAGAVVAPDEIWSSNAAGAVIVSGGIHRLGALSSFEEAKLVIKVEGSGSVVAADYAHVPLTDAESVILFTYLLAGVDLDTQVKLNLTNADDSPLLFEAAFFKDECPYEQPSTPEFVDSLPIGKIKTTSQPPAAQPDSEQPAQGSPTVVTAGDVRVVTFQQRIPLTVTLFIPPGISGTHTIELPLDLDVQVRMDDDNPPTASARLSDPSKPIAIPITTKSPREKAGNQLYTHSPAPSQLKPGRRGPTEVCGEIAVETVWEADASPYIVKCNLTIAAVAKLTIQPGVVVKFGGTALYVDGALQVLGTEELPVYFTSLNDDELGGDTNGDGTASSPKAGNWYFVQFNERSDDENSLIEHLEIRYSGSNRAYGAIRLVNASPTLRAISFAKNALNGVEIATDKLETDTWDNTDVVYVVRANVTIAPDQTLTIVPGMVVKFAGAALYVDNALQVQGTEELPVYFTSLNDDELGGDTNGDGTASSPKAGNWYFVQFNERSDDENSLIEHLEIRYSGSNRAYGAIRLVNASPTLRAISFAKNALNGVEIATDKLETDTWDNTDVVYVVRANVTIAPDQTLTIVPGMVVKFAGAALYVDNALQVQGTEESPVYFTSLSDDELGGDTNGDGTASSPKAGNWYFVQFNERSDDENSLIEHLEIRYSGGNRAYGAIRLVNASPTLLHITYENNARNEVETVQ